ncbi:MAG TPA: hypothetical protein VGD97_06865 [Lacunisphaera sp.]
MIDRAARDSLAEHLRQLASGTISNFAFEERPKNTSGDPSIHAIGYGLAWPNYDDFKEHRLDGGFKLTDGQKKDFARAVMFLKTDLEFRWPKQSFSRSLRNYFGRVFSYGAWMPEPDGGDRAVWPFWTKDEYELALENPPYLAGKPETDLHR